METPSFEPEDWENLESGINLFNQERFFEAHEYWEIIWKKYDASWRIYLQGLIQMAAGLHQLKELKFKGASLNLQKSLDKLHTFPKDFCHINNQDLIHAIQSILVDLSEKPPLEIEENLNSYFCKIKLSP